VRDDEREFLAEAVQLANLPSLLMVLAQLTGEERWLREPYLPKAGRGISDNDSGGLPEEIQREVRGAAAAAIEAWRGGRPVAWPEPSSERLLSMLSIAMAEPVPEDYSGLLAAEILDHGTQVPSIDAPPDLHVAIVGAGFSGLIAAYRLRQAGVACTVLERSESVGGVWFENRYPGAGVDTPSHLYSVSFARHDWPAFFALRDDVRVYLEELATGLDLRSVIRLGTEVIRATWDDDTQAWALDLRNSDGGTDTLRASALISAVGIFNPPVVPAIPGLETFAGESVHTARWPEGLDLTGKRVAVVGNGASAMQAVPAIADQVASLTIFQRSPQWAMPFERFRQPVPEPVRWLMREVPLYARWYRARLGWIWTDRILPSLQIDPAWEHGDRSINLTNDRTRSMLVEYIRSELGDRQDLFDKVVPNYPPFGKRMLLDNGWFRTLIRDHVQLVTESIAEIRADRIVTDSGVEHEVDTIVLATGFDVARFLTSFEIVGRNGVKLQEEWQDDGRAYLGSTIPGFPNLFCIYGPNVQAGHGGSVIISLERQVHHIVSVLAEMVERGAGTVEVDPAAHRAYNEAVDARLSSMVWTHPGMNTYYRNAAGRIVANSPYRYAEWWHMTDGVNTEHYRFASALPATENAVLCSPTIRFGYPGTTEG
jgi:4-hydroxyacetophenone monooxygenase